jgi:hypothetical protein
MRGALRAECAEKMFGIDLHSPATGSLVAEKDGCGHPKFRCEILCFGSDVVRAKQDRWLHCTQIGIPIDGLMLDGNVLPSGESERLKPTTKDRMGLGGLGFA